MNAILTGAIAMAFAVAALFFLRFWRQTGDRLFALFALSYLILAVNRAALGLRAEQNMEGDHLYWVRLLAFTLILLAILDKNRVRRQGTLDQDR
jgi:hypothetical protein